MAERQARALTAAICALALALAMAAGCARQAARARDADHAPAAITILHTNDTAGYVDPCG